MSRILLADDSPHAQRMGERILRDEGHEVITVSDGKVAMLRLEDAMPDIIIADISMPEVSGYRVCTYVKSMGSTPVFLTAGAIEPVDEEEVKRSGADGFFKKPFEASILLAAIAKVTKPAPTDEKPIDMAGKSVVVIDPEQIRAAVTLALDAAMPALVDTLTENVMTALLQKKR